MQPEPDSYNYILSKSDIPVYHDILEYILFLKISCGSSWSNTIELIYNGMNRGNLYNSIQV